MALCHFATDLHGRPDRYRKLWDAAAAERPAALFLGGDLLPHRLAAGDDFVAEVLADGFRRLRAGLGPAYPAVFLIPGNDDPAAELPGLAAGEDEGLWIQAHGRRVAWGDRLVLGYACIPPSPFLLKDWERYDVSRYVDPGCVSPEEGRRTVAREEREIRLATIAADLERAGGRRGSLAGGLPLPLPAVRLLPGPRRAGRPHGRPRAAGRAHREHRDPAGSSRRGARRCRCTATCTRPRG